MRYQYCIVGAGLFGSVIAQQAKRYHRKVVVLDKRPHIGGNCHTEDRDGIHVHRYGPHIFHCNSDDIWKYVNQFTTFNNYVHRVKAVSNKKIYSFPINLMTIHQIFGTLSHDDAKRAIENDIKRCQIPSADNLESWCLKTIGPTLYHTFIKGYTEKQWGRRADTLPSSIIKRIPQRWNYDDSYYNDKYQGIPDGGYTKMFQNMLDGVEVQLGIDYLAERDYWDSKADIIIYSGKIDEFFRYRFGPLGYRSLEFNTFKDYGTYQGTAQMNYTSSFEPFTRIIEHKFFEPDKKHDYTWVTKEYPAAWKPGSEAYYPIGDEQNAALYQKYHYMTKDCPRHIFGGRLGSYRYYDMHQVIGQALKLSKQLFT